MCDCNQETMINAKMAAEQAQQAGIGRAPYYGDQCKEIPLRESLAHRLRRTEADRESVSKALRILEAHPEFEDFLWLLRSGVI